MGNHVHRQWEVIRCFRSDGTDESNIFPEEVGEMEIVNLVVRYAESEECPVPLQELKTLLDLVLLRFFQILDYDSVNAFKTC